MQIRVGSKMLLRTIDRTTMKEFFRKVARKAEYEDQAVRHMSLFNSFKLLEFTFHKGFKKNVELKYLREGHMILMPEISKALRKKEYLRMWRERLLSN